MFQDDVPTMCGTCVFAWTYLVTTAEFRRAMRADIILQVCPTFQNLPGPWIRSASLNVQKRITSFKLRVCDPVNGEDSLLAFWTQAARGSQLHAHMLRHICVYIAIWIHTCTTLQFCVDRADKSRPSARNCKETQLQWWSYHTMMTHVEQYGGHTCMVTCKTTYANTNAD